MCKFLSIILTFFNLGLTIEKINLPSQAFNEWEVLQNDKTWIGWTEFENYPICKSERILNHSFNEVSRVIENKEKYPDIFERITQVKLYEKDIIHVYLDMPFPISSRDYIVKYEISETIRYKEFYFYSVNHPNSIQFKGAIRLPNAGGKWILEKLDNKQTKVTYMWNGQLLGDFPDWALTKAWVEQGEEVLEWLNSALNRSI
ncbi:MAG: hypothetical protein CMF96_12350 [Candidatus Marinimicrobia bacterium]|nr:hypothetical protein [Candidatus Neomarinimicrobiota bacterium]